MSPAPAKTRLLVLVALLALLAGTAAAARWAILPWAVGAALKAGGASDVTFDVTRATPWRVQVDDLAFKVSDARVAARRASLERSHWWTPSLGRLKVETARVELDLERLPKASQAGENGAAPAGPARIPLEEFSVDGQVKLQAGDDPVQTLAVRFAAKPDATGRWEGTADVAAPGLELAVTAGYTPADAGLDFRTTALRLELEAWQKWWEHWAPLPWGPWEVGGIVTGTLQGGYHGEKFDATGELHLREGRAANAELGLVAEGIEGDLGGLDLSALQAERAQARGKRVILGKVELSEVTAELAHVSADRLEVRELSARALGGKLLVEPFTYLPAEPAIEAVVKAEGIRAEKVLALTQDLPARATGPLSGRLPLRYENGAIRLGTGWLGLEAGASLELQLQAEGLLTAGTPPKSPNYAVLKQVEDGLLKLKVTELRLDVRPPDAPGTRTAQLHLVGAPVDPKVKAPVTLDLNVNGPIESLLNLGLRTGAAGGTKP